MHPEPPEESGLIIRGNASLAKLPDGGTPALSEILNRSLVHIQTSKILGTRHRIGDHELCGPDYRLVCAWAEELKLRPDEVLFQLLSDHSEWHFLQERLRHKIEKKSRTAIVMGQFKLLNIIQETLPVSIAPRIEELAIETLILRLLENVSRIDLAAFPSLVELDCSENRLAELDLTLTPNLRTLDCSCNYLTRLDLSSVPKLTKLSCRRKWDPTDVIPYSGYRSPYWTPHFSKLILSDVPNLEELDCTNHYLQSLDLSSVRNLRKLICPFNQLFEIDLSFMRNLENLICHENPLIELDIRPLINLQNLSYDPRRTRLIQRPDQNF